MKYKKGTFILFAIAFLSIAQLFVANNAIKNFERDKIDRKSAIAKVSGTSEKIKWLVDCGMQEGKKRRACEEKILQNPQSFWK